MLQSLDRSGGSLYMQIYSDIRRDILFGKLTEGEKLPSKRELAERLRVSLITVENAYAQLIAEGYIRAVERSGYYVQFSGIPITTPDDAPTLIESIKETHEDNPAGNNLFPFNVWARLMRSVIIDKSEKLLLSSDSRGVYELREEISRYLYRSRGISVLPRQIIIGAGAEYLYNMLIQLLGRERRYAMEDPCYPKLSKIYDLNGVKWVPVSLDEQGMSCKELYLNNVSVAHISPAHHFPTGIVMPISRRRAIMHWAEEIPNRYIIEDDYDSEFRWNGKPVPTMFGMDNAGRVIYINTFSVTIAPSVRIGYMCLPEALCDLWEEKLSFCSCPVPVFEQYTLARFISNGSFERHISRMKKHYHHLRELVLKLFSNSHCRITEENAGLHFLVTTDKADNIAEICSECNISFTALSEYSSKPSDERTFIVNYRGADIKLLEKALNKS